MVTVQSLSSCVLFPLVLFVLRLLMGASLHHDGYHISSIISYTRSSPSFPFSFMTYSLFRFKVLRYICVLIAIAVFFRGRISNLHVF